MDLVTLSRLQFALTVMFHYLFPPITIGLGLLLVHLEWRYLRTRDEAYKSAAKFWTGLFALNFALGVASGIVMEFQFGTNWSAYSRFVGDVFGSALAAEGILAFFIESSFLAILVFGWDRVGPRLHFFSTVMVAFGAILSSVWIVVANSWQQTPAGHRIATMLRDGKPWLIEGKEVLRAEIVDFWAVVFNPSSVHRLVHVWLGAAIMGSFFVLSISAFYLLKRRHEAFARLSSRGALVLGAAASIAILFSGHQQAKNVYRYQPAKLATFEGHFRTEPAALTVFGIPDPASGKIHAALQIPGGLSFLLHGRTDKEVLGLDRFRLEDRPPVLIPFFCWRIMVFFGFVFAGLTTAGTILLLRGTIWRARCLLWAFLFAAIPAVIANQAGWVAAEVGRQPWIVHPPIPRDGAGELVLDRDGLVRYDERLGLRTADGVSATVSAEEVAISLAGFGGVYTLLGFLWIFVLARKIRKGPSRAGSSAGGKETKP